MQFYPKYFYSITRNKRNKIFGSTLTKEVYSNYFA